MKKTDAQKIRDLKARVRELEDKLDEVSTDRQMFRAHFENRFKWWFELMSNSQTPDLVSLAKFDALQLRRFKYWMFS